MSAHGGGGADDRAGLLRRPQAGAEIGVVGDGDPRRAGDGDSRSHRFGGDCR